MKHLVAICFIAAAASAQDAQVKGRQIVDDAIKVLGGEKFLKVQNRIETGRAFSFFLDELSGLSVARFYTRYIPQDPSKSGEELAQQEYQGLGKEEAFYRLFREEGAWEVTYRGPKPIEKEQFDRYHDATMNNFFYIVRNRLSEPGLVFEFRGSDVIENTPLNLVDIIDSKNRVVTVYFHPTTKLPMRESWSWRDADRERNDEVVRFARFRDVDGTLWPFQTNRERNGRKIYEMFADSVVINQPIEEARFAIPTDDSRPIKTPLEKKR